MPFQTNPIAPGPKTTEFYTTVASAIGVGALALGISNDIQTTDALAQLISNALTGTSAIFVIGWIVVEYIKGRRNIKTLLIEKGLIPEGPVVVTPPVIAPTPPIDAGSNEPSV